MQRGVLVIVIVIEGFVVVLTPHEHIIVVSLIMLAIVIAPHTLVVVFALGVLVIFIALGILIVDGIGKGLVVVCSDNRHVIVVIAIGKGLFNTIVANGILIIVFALGIHVIFITLGVFVVNFIGEGIVVIGGGGNGHVIIILALGKGLVGTVAANSILIVIIGDVAVLGLLIVLVVITLGKGLVVAVITNGVLIIIVGDVTLLGVLQVPSLSLFFNGLHFTALIKPKTMTSTLLTSLPGSASYPIPPLSQPRVFGWLLHVKYQTVTI